jgi:hypothetical protein
MSSRLTSTTALCLILLILYPSNRNNKTWVRFVHSFPTGAGGCDGDGPAVGGSHIFSNKTSENGDLATGGILVSVGGIELDPTVKDVDFPLNQDLTIFVNVVPSVPRCINPDESSGFFYRRYIHNTYPC